MQGPQTHEALGVRVVIGSLLLVALAGLIFYTVGPLAGTLVAVAMIGFGAWALLRTDRREEIEVAPAPSQGRRRLLIVADGRAPARTLSEQISRPRTADARSEASSMSVRLVVPAPASTGEKIASATDEARAEAERRLKTLLADLRLTGVEADGEVGDPDPTTALEDGLRRFPADEILIQTANGEGSWDALVDRAREDSPVPMRVV